MTSADRRRLAYQRHIAFLRNVTGLEFGPAYMDELARGVAFRAVLSARCAGFVVPVEIVSIIREREDICS